MKNLAVFVPVYNEEKIVERNITRILDEAKKQKLDIMLYAVDDSSADSTPEILKRMEKKYKNLRRLRFADGPSRRENLAKAMAASKEPYLLFLDLDLATSPSYMGRLYTLLKQGADVATGSRYCAGSNVSRSASRLAISRLYNSFMRLYFGSALRDHQCGFKGFSRPAFESIHKSAGIDSTKQRGWFWDAEIMIIAQRKGYKIAEFGVSWKEGKKSSFSLRRELKMIPYVLSLKRKLASL